MNTTPSKLTTATLFAALVIPATLRAIEAPEDNAPPPAAAAQPAAPASAFLGIITSPTPQVLREHLNLGEKEGVIVTSVIPDGPAAKAGLNTNDVITRIDDKKITCPQEISDLIAEHKVGDEIRITSIHKGKATEAKVTLGERPAHLPMARQMGMQEIPALEGMPDELADRIRRMVEQNAGGIELPLGAPDAIPIPPDMKGAMDEMRKDIEGMRGGMKLELGLDGNGIQAHRAATFRMMDNEGSIELKSSDDSKEVTVRDQENNIVWQGPWDTEQDKAAAPDDIRQRIERLNIDANAGGLRLNLRPNR